MTKVQMIEVNKDDNDIRLDRWFKRNFPKVSHTSIEKALRKGQIRVDSKKVKSNYRVQEGEVIRVPPMTEYKKEAKPQKAIPEKYITMIKESVIYKDEEIIVINKPAGIAVQGGVGVDVSIDSLLDHLQFDAPSRPKLVHRLDKDTSGILVLARKTSVAATLGDAFRKKDMEKIYWAVVVGVPNEPEGKITLPIIKQEAGAGKEKVVVDEEHGHRATTNYKTLDKAGNRVSLVELRPVTGRTHQLRVHMAATGNPILGDGKYGGKDAFIEGLGKKMHLHARKIVLPPRGKKKRDFTADLSNNMDKTMKELGLED